MLISAEELINITKGKFITFPSASTNFSINSKEVKENDTFIAINGEKIDSHLYIDEAIAKGARLIIANKTNEANLKTKKVSIFVVENTLESLQKIAVYCRKQFKGRVIGITGSVGKTTLKEMLVYLLEETYKVFYTKGNLNNNIGMPLCLANISGDEDIAILEMGMNNKGEISLLSNIALPNIAVITDISLAHSVNFNTIEDIALAKLEIVEGLVEGGDVIINKDNDVYNFVINHLNKYKDFSSKVKAYGYIKNIKTYFRSWNDFGIQANISINDKYYSMTVHSIYKHTILLALICLIIFKILQIPITKNVLDKLSSFKNIQGRGQILICETKEGKTFTLIDDSYNANPTSMKAALISIECIKKFNKILILGDMLELGIKEKQEHINIIRYIINNEPKVVILIGPLMSSLKYELDVKGIKSYCYLGKKDLNVDSIIDLISSEDIILAKGSFSSGVYNLINELRDKIKIVK